MASPDPVRPHEDSLGRPDGRGVSQLEESDGVVMALAELPDHQHTTDADLLTAVRDGDPLAFVEMYQRTAPAAHAVARRLLASTAHVEAALRQVYGELWTAPPDGGSLVQWVRARTFAIATAELRRRGAAPAMVSVATILEGPPAPKTHHLSTAERALAALPEGMRRAVLLAHDAGVSAADQSDPEAADLLEVGLLSIADPEAAPDTLVASGVPGLGGWALGLLPESEATAVAASVRADASLAAHCAALHLARRRLEGLPASPHTSQRIVADVLAVAPTPAPVPALAPVDDLPRQKPATKGGLGLVAASLVLVLVAGVLLLADRAPVDQQLAVAQAAPAPTANAAPPAREPAGEPQRLVPRQRRRPEPPPILRPAPSAPQVSAGAPPVRVTVPKMGVDKRLVSLSVLGDGTLAAPDNYDTPGWYRDGVAPGDVGPAVIVGHVDSMDGPAVFFALEKLKRGDKARVKRADGTNVTFIVDRVERYAKAEFPTDEVYGPTPGAELRLITCGGAFDNTTLSYDDNVVAYAHIQQPRSRANKPNNTAKQDKAKADKTKREKAKDDKAEPEKTRRARSDDSKTYDHLGRLRTSPEAGDQRARRRDGRNPETAADA